MTAASGLGHVRPVRAAVVGAGLMGRWHTHALTRAGGVLSLVVDPDPQRAHALAKRHAHCRVAADFRDVDRQYAESLDVVHICTPPVTHASLATDVLRTGLHVVVEKPLAPTVAATDALLQLASARGRLVCPVHQLLFQTGVLRAQAALSSIGPLRYADIVACTAGADGHADNDRDHLATEILPHPLSLLVRMLPMGLTGVSWRLTHLEPGELRATGHAGAVSISILVSTRGRPTTHTVRLIGEHATVYIDLFHGFHVLDRGPVSRAQKIAHPLLLSGGVLRAATTNLLARAARQEPAYPGLQELVRRVYQAVRGRADPPISAAEIRAVAAAHETLSHLL